MYAVAMREKGTVAHYYACEVVGNITGGRPYNLSGEPITGARAIYRPDRSVPEIPGGRILLIRPANDQDEKTYLGRELVRIYGPGELVTGVACQCETTCGMLKKRL